MSQQVNNKASKVNHLTTISLGKYLNEFYIRKVNYIRKVKYYLCINSDDINII